MIIELSEQVRLESDVYQWTVKFKGGSTWAPLGYFSDLRNIPQYLRERKIALPEAGCDVIERVATAFDVADNRLFAAMGSRDWRDTELQARKVVLWINDWARVDTDSRKIQVAYSVTRHGEVECHPKHFHHSLRPALRTTLHRRVRRGQGSGPDAVIAAIRATAREICRAARDGLSEDHESGPLQRWSTV